MDAAFEGTLESKVDERFRGGGKESMVDARRRRVATEMGCGCGVDEILEDSGE